LGVSREDDENIISHRVSIKFWPTECEWSNFCLKLNKQYWSRVVRVSSTNPIPYASDAMVGRCRSTMRRIDNLKRSGFVYKRPRLNLFFVVVVIFLHFLIDSAQNTCKHT
jgi:hypothetical protein